MISLFRKIRQKLLSQNQISRYLVYAIGEIILVIVGILIALQVNNLNETRKSKIELNKTIDNLEEDLVANYHFANSKLQFYRNSDSLLRLTIAGDLTIEDYKNNSDLRNILVDWDLFTPQTDNIYKLIESEKLISADLIPLLQSVKLLKQQETWLTHAWEKLDAVVDDNFKFYSENIWSNVDSNKGIEFRQNSPTYKQKAILYSSLSRNYANNITRYKARNLATLSWIQRAKNNLTNVDLKQYLNSIGMKPFQQIDCGASINDLTTPRTYRSHELAINGTNKKIVLRLSFNKGANLDSLVLNPLEIAPIYSLAVGRSGDYNILVERLDNNGKCIQKFGAVHNGYLLIE